jgi:hypothetical protein
MPQSFFCARRMQLARLSCNAENRLVSLGLGGFRDSLKAAARA